MAIPESDISILIPTYRYRDKVTRAVESALASGAGEVIVLDDCGRDGTVEVLAGITDRRLTVLENDRNLGLWENHLKALSLATKSWIKFIQADDYLLPSGLAKYAEAAGAGVTVISGLPTIRDDQTGETWLTYKLSKPLALDWTAFESMFVRFGNLLGSPSFMMLRADAIERDPEVWNTRISADLVIGAIAAAHGKVVVLPPGAIGHGVHPLQESKTENAPLGLARIANSVAYLRARPEIELRRLANLWTVLSIRSMLKTMARGLIRKEGSLASIVSPVWQLLAKVSCSDWQKILSYRAAIVEAKRNRATSARPFDLDEAFTRPNTDTR